jgi:hypothetical protein
MLFFGSHIIENNHPHIHTVVLFLRSSLFLLIGGCLVEFNLSILLNLLDDLDTFCNFLNGLLVFLHFTENSSFVEVGRHNIMFVLNGLLFIQNFFYFQGEADCS